uniref:Uncharacterized protein n=1 Tax=Oryza punctata TaxID=4537 RepID=A0A0E0K099_ORYPU
MTPLLDCLPHHHRGCPPRHRQGHPPWRRGHPPGLAVGRLPVVPRGEATHCTFVDASYRARPPPLPTSTTPRLPRGRPPPLPPLDLAVPECRWVGGAESGYFEHQWERGGTERRGGAGSGHPRAPVAGGKGREEEVAGGKGREEEVANGLPTPPPSVEVEEEVRGKERRRGKRGGERE